MFVTGRRKTELDEAVDRLGGRTIGVEGDISRLSDLDRLYDTVRREAGQLDVLFANAGGGEFLPLGQITEAHVDKWLSINFKGTFLLSRRRCRSCRMAGRSC